MDPDAIWASVGGIGGLVASLVGLIVSIRSGVLVSGGELIRLQASTTKQLDDQAKVHAEELARLEKLFGGTIEHERSDGAEWRRNAERLQEALDVALKANAVWARQAEVAAVSSDLTNRVLETIRQQAISQGRS
jgi:hypothetical protein